MNGKLIYDNVQILNVEKKISDDASITWYEAITNQEGNINVITIDKDVAGNVKNGQYYDFELTVKEVLKSTRNGGAYKANKFKITAILEN